MINAPKPGTTEFTAYLEEEKRQAETQEHFIRLHQDHELKMKELDLKIAQTEASLKASLKVVTNIVKFPLLLVCILPITFMVMFGIKVPNQLWRIISLDG